MTPASIRLRLPLALPLLCLLTAGCAITRVTIETQPPDAALYWDNTYIGTSPITFEPPLNQDAVFEEVHIVEAVKDGYMTGLGYIAEKGKGQGLMTDRLTIRLHEAPEWYISSKPAPPQNNGQVQAAPAPEMTFEEALESVERIACDIRVVRVRDQKVLATVYGVSATQRLIILAEQLAEQLGQRLRDDVAGPVVLVRLRNRRRSPAGEKIAAELTQMIAREVADATRLEPKKIIDLRPLIEPRMLDHSKIVTHPKVRKMLNGADYILQGGLAESRDPRRSDAIVDYHQQDENERQQRQDAKENAPPQKK
jgi:hypothetical protein